MCSQLGGALAEKKETQEPVIPNDEDEKSVALAKRAREGNYDDDLILEQLARNRVFLKDDGLKALRSSFVIIVGCGGVGSHAAAALARSGVSMVRLIDFDQVTLSSLNRHALATLADVGTPKVECVRRRLEQATPWVHFDCRNELFQREAADDQLASWQNQSPSYIIDAIDNIDSKVELLKHCHEKRLPVICSMGAGCKSDPTRIHLGDISSTIEDPLSRSTRRRLRALGVANGIPTVFSSEKASPGKAQLMPLPDEEYEKGTVQDLGVLPDFRVRILPVLGTMPAIFGLCVANHIILELGSYPHEYLLSKGREKMYESILGTLQSFEQSLARHAGEDAVGLRIPVSQEDVGYLVEEVYRGRSVVSGLSARLVLIRWRPPPHAPGTMMDTQFGNQKFSKLSLNDLVCMTREEATWHEINVLKAGETPESVYDQSVVEKVADKLREEESFSTYR
ncbi:MAG: hypothetical protein M1831_003895 [Alyxoria varia]|nr:MAG: hypothetical protein M1831_003895 [Alyxoria varia]